MRPPANRRLVHSAPEDALPSLPKLGVGLAYQAELRPFIERETALFDFLEVVPDICWTDRGRRVSPRYVADPGVTALLREVAATKPVVPHSIGLSIGSAHRFERAHLAQMRRWYDWLDFPWHSDHLAFHLAAHDDAELNVNLTLPVTLDRETLALVGTRIVEVRREIPVPFLIENNVYYFAVPEQEFDEATFLNELCAASGSGLLLDLHNLHVNCRNHGTDPFAFLDRLDLDRVGEIHVAGGIEFDGFYLDAHSGAAPPPVWELLDWTLPRCRHVGGVVFELFGSWFARLGPAALRRQLRRMRELWDRHQPMPARRSA